MDTNNSFEVPALILNLQAQGYLRSAGKWAYFLGILGFIGSGLVLLLALFISSFFSVMATFQPAMATMPTWVGGAMGFVYLLIAVFYFFFSLYLFQFGSRIKKGILYIDEVEVTNALGKLKSFFKLWGITTIVIIALYLLFIIIAIIVGVSAASMMSK